MNTVHHEPNHDANVSQLPVAAGSHGHGSTELVPFDPYMNPHVSDDEIDLREIWNVLVRYRWTILIFLGVVTATTVIATLLMRPVYQAATLLEIIPSSRNIVKFQNLEQSELQPREFIQTQANILRSESVASAAISNLGIASHPELNGQLEQRGIVSGIRQVLSVFNSADAVSDEYTELVGERKRLERFEERLRVAPIRNSNLFEVSFESFDPVLAADVANAVSEQFIKLNDERRFNSTSGAKSFLQQEIQRVQAKLERSEKDLNAFARKHQIVDLEDKNNIMSTRLQELNRSLTEVQSDRIRAEALYTQAQHGQVESLPAILQEDLIRNLKEEYTRLQAEYFKLANIYKDAYPKLQQVRAQMSQVKLSLDQEVGKIVASLKTNFEQLNERERLLQVAVKSQKNELLDLQDRAVQFNILKREWETNKELYSGLLERMKEVGVAAGMEMNNVAVIDHAAVPIKPSSPKLLLNFGIAGILGLLGGVGLAFLLAYLDNTIATPEELERIAHVASLGLLPKIDAKILDNDASLDLVSEVARDSELSEAFRSIRTSLMFSSPQGAPKKLYVTSTTFSEGKTTNAVNLAIVLAQQGAKVLLVDADLRKPRVHKVFGIPSSPGLSEHLVGQEKSNRVFRTNIHNLSVMAAGIPPPNPAELLNSSKMDAFLQVAQDMFDYVICDGPPIMGIADAIVTSVKMDGVVLVVSTNGVTKEALKESVKRLRSVRAPLVGAILNMVEMTRSQYGYYNSYYRYQPSESKEEEQSDQLAVNV